MCLISVDKEKPAPTGKGWKCFFEVNGGELRSPFWGRAPIYLEAWMTAEERTILCHIHESEGYTSGFHIFQKREDAESYAESEDWVIREVEYCGAHTQGKDEWKGCQTIVAREMKLLARPKNA